MFRSIEKLKQQGFSGFCRIQDLCNDCSMIPNQAGVYMILYNNPNSPKFIQKGSGGFFKGKDPNVSLEALNSKWVDNSVVIYIGQAGGKSSSATLRKRIWQYIRFGNGIPVGHYGGRYIWQIEDSGKLLVCWKPSLTEDARLLESKFLNDFRLKYKKMPFANLVS